MRARAYAHLAGDRADLRLRPAVRAALLDRDLLADEVLVDRLGRLADVRLGRAVAGAALGALGRRRERQVDGVDDPVVEQVLLGRLQLLGVLLGLGEGAQVGLELGANRAVGRGGTLLLEDRRE